MIDFLVFAYRYFAWWMLLPAWYWYKTGPKAFGAIIMALCLIAIACNIADDLAPRANTEQAADYDPFGE